MYKRQDYWGPITNSYGNPSITKAQILQNLLLYYLLMLFDSVSTNRSKNHVKNDSQTTIPKSTTVDIHLEVNLKNRKINRFMIDSE